MSQKQRERLYFLDNLKIPLIILVVVHHAGQAYGGGGWWFVENPERSSLLGIFFTVNRSFFMSLFFMISGYFLPASYDRNGPLDFLKDRFLRLGVPLLGFFLFQGTLAKTMAANTYAVYLFHVPVVVLLNYAILNISLYPLIKFILVSLAGVPLTFLISNYIRRLPLARSIL
jgi:peptidoglycan/LPS O-acetylase OafA/YrhL